MWGKPPAWYVFSVPAGREPLVRGGERNERNPGDKIRTIIMRPEGGARGAGVSSCVTFGTQRLSDYLSGGSATLHQPGY
jgi:hypothetical protein